MQAPGESQYKGSPPEEARREVVSCSPVAAVDVEQSAQVMCAQGECLCGVLVSLSYSKQNVKCLGRHQVVCGIVC